MLKNIIIVSFSGLVLFSKEFNTAVAQPRLIGSLLTAMMEFSSKIAGMPVSYIELKNVASTIVASDACNVYCALFHDTADGPAFGRLLAVQILNAFVNMYSKNLNNGAAGHDLKDFEDFHFKLKGAMKSCTGPLLAGLQSGGYGVDRALLVSSESKVFPGVHDQIGFRANLEVLKGVANHVMSIVSDGDVEEVSIDRGEGVRILVHRVPGWKATSLVLQCSNTAVDEQTTKTAIKDALRTLTKLNRLASSMATR